MNKDPKIIVVGSPNTGLLNAQRIAALLYPDITCSIIYVKNFEELAVAFKSA